MASGNSLLGEKGKGHQYQAYNGTVVPGNVLSELKHRFILQVAFGDCYRNACKSYINSVSIVNVGVENDEAFAILGNAGARGYVLVYDNRCFKHLSAIFLLFSFSASKDNNSKWVFVIEYMNKKELKKLVFATNNLHKLEEAREILAGEFEIVSLAEIGCHDDIPETADTLEGNALIKARWVKEKYGYDCFADDTGLMVDALGGAPGVYSARYAGEHCTFADNVNKMLREMMGKSDRKAHFATVVALVLNGETNTFEGRVDGYISEEAHGDGGFGYDPIFIAEETGRSFAEMAPEEKNAISHRGRAMRKLADFLKTNDF